MDEAVIRRDVPLFALHVAEAIVVGVAVGQEGLRRGACVLPFLRVARLDVDKVIPFLVVGHQVDIHAGHLIATQFAGSVGLPSVAPEHVARAFVVQVVGLSIEAYVRTLVASHSEEACQVGRLVLPKACSCLNVCYPAHCIFPFQPHIDDVVLTAFVGPSEPFVLFGLFVIDGHILHRIGRQVLEYQFAIALKEVLSVEQEIVHELAVVVDSSVALEFDARQLANQGVEHRAFRQLEQAGIVHDGVALMIETDARRLDGHLLQGLRNLMKIEGRHVARRFPSAHTVQHIIVADGTIVVHRNAEDIVPRQGGHLYVVAWRIVVHLSATTVVVEGRLSGTDRVDEYAVFTEEFHLCIHQILARPSIADNAGKFDGTRFVSLVILNEDFLPSYLCLDRKSRTD